MSQTTSDPPWAVGVDADAGLAVGRMWGAVTGADMLRMVESLHAHPDWRPGMDTIWDCRGVTGRAVDPEDVGPIVAAEAASGPGHSAIVEGADGSSVTALLAALLVRRGKAVSVHKEQDEALAAMGRGVLPEALEAVGPPRRVA